MFANFILVRGGECLCKTFLFLKVRQNWNITFSQSRESKAPSTTDHDTMRLRVTSNTIRVYQSGNQSRESWYTPGPQLILPSESTNMSYMCLVVTLLTVHADRRTVVQTLKISTWRRDVEHETYTHLNFARRRKKQIWGLTVRTGTTHSRLVYTLFTSSHF